MEAADVAEEEQNKIIKIIKLPGTLDSVYKRVYDSFSDPFSATISNIGFTMYGPYARGRSFITPKRITATSFTTTFLVIFDPYGDSRQKGTRGRGYKYPSVYVYEVDNGIAVASYHYDCGSVEGRWTLLNSGISIESVAPINIKGGTMTAGCVRLTPSALASISEATLSALIGVNDDKVGVGLSLAHSKVFLYPYSSFDQFRLMGGGKSSNLVRVFLSDHALPAQNIPLGSAFTISSFNPFQYAGATPARVLSISGTSPQPSRCTGDVGDVFDSFTWDITVPCIYAGNNTGVQTLTYTSVAVIKALAVDGTDSGYSVYDSNGIYYSTAASYVSSTGARRTLICPATGGEINGGLRLSGSANLRYTQGVSLGLPNHPFTYNADIYAMITVSNVSQGVVGSTIVTGNGNISGTMYYNLAYGGYGDAVAAAVIAPTNDGVSYPSISIVSAINAIVTPTPQLAAQVPSSGLIEAFNDIIVPPSPLHIKRVVVKDL